ncbi:MAG: alpha/beta hydrolase [Collinsella sp.]|nr:alpha/beta hydrolase [Collinsella sp.]
MAMREDGVVGGGRAGAGAASDEHAVAEGTGLSGPARGGRSGAGGLAGGCESVVAGAATTGAPTGLASDAGRAAAPGLVSGDRGVGASRPAGGCGRVVAGGLGITCREAAGAPTGLAVVYLHGGGFLYGERDDLPAPYVRQITEAGHALVTLDYPLAPECPLPEIIDAAWKGLGSVVREVLPELDCTSYVLFGRSAGGYLALALAARAVREGGDAVPAPVAIWDFYGYHDLTEAFVSEPSPHYRAMPEVGRAVADRLAGEPGSSAGGGPYVLTGPKATRFGLYVHARQSGRWLELLGIDEHAAVELSLSHADIARLPPVFIAASTGDADVPLGVSKRLARAAPRARMHQVYYLEHDFDRDTGNPAGREAYAAALTFTAEL